MLDHMDTNIAIWAIGILVTIGIVYGDIRARLSRVEGALGRNGEEGVFVRRKENETLQRGTEEILRLTNERMNRIQGQINHIIERQDYIISRLEPK